MESHKIRMSGHLRREDLMTLETFAEQRSNFQREVMGIKKFRQVNLGGHIRLLFENQKTVQYQIQEMLRIEKIFEVGGIQDELDTYNPLIPDGSNLKATMMIEYADDEERKEALAKLIGVERQIFIKVGSHEKVFPICNEDLERETTQKTSAVHFLRFEFTGQMVMDFSDLGTVIAGVKHKNYQAEETLDDQVIIQLATDFYKT